MLIKCPECELQISDKAVSCPHCGYPLKPNIIRERQSTKRKRLPNGFGQISKIKGKNLRKPFRAMVSTGKNPETGRPIVRPLQPESYFSTYNEAYSALLEYNKSPYDLDVCSITLKQVYDEWSEKYYKTLSKSAYSVHMAAWNYCTELYDMKISDIKPRHIRNCIDECSKESIKKKIKVLLGLVFDYAVENEYVDKNVVRDTKYKFNDEIQNAHRSFTDDEMQILWNNVTSEKYIDLILIQCYTGFRPQEMGNITIDNVDLDNWTITGGMKTSAGKNRTVPIHEKIKGLVKTKYKVAKVLGSEHLFNIPRSDDPDNVAKMKVTYDRYNWVFESAMKNLGIEGHRPHDPRKTFVTLAKRYNVNEYAIKLIVGHTITDITEKTYTERDPKWLAEEINKIEIEVPENIIY